MRPPPYPLQAALEQREAARRDARLTLAARVRQAEGEKLALEERQTQCDALVADDAGRRERLYEPDGEGLLTMPVVTRRTEALRYIERRIEEVQLAVEEKREALAQAEGAVEACRRRLVEADRELKAVERHREGWLEGWKRAMARKEQRQAEEGVAARYTAERAGGEGEGAS